MFGWGKQSRKRNTSHWISKGLFGDMAIYEEKVGRRFGVGSFSLHLSIWWWSKYLVSWMGRSEIISKVAVDAEVVVRSVADRMRCSGRSLKCMTYEHISRYIFTDVLLFLKLWMFFFCCSNGCAEWIVAIMCGSWNGMKCVWTERTNGIPMDCTMRT